LQFSAVSILAFACITLFTNIDVVIVKHFFSSFETGIYGVASELAKIVFFLTSSISLVLLPKAAGDHAIRKNPKGILYKTLGFVGLVSAIAVLAYFLFPNLIISFLFGKEYIAAASLVGLFALGMAFYSLNNVLVYYFISIGRKNFALVLGFFAVLEVLLLVLFHNALSAIVSIFASTMFLLFIVLLAYSFIDRKVESSEF
jgi:O-antigen/teichoic acid export membrane protein